jgi:hypothetical protein
MKRNAVLALIGNSFFLIPLKFQLVPNYKPPEHKGPNGEANRRAIYRASMLSTTLASDNFI